MFYSDLMRKRTLVENVVGADVPIYILNNNVQDDSRRAQLEWDEAPFYQM